MRGQLVFEFIITVVVFLGIIIFVLNILNSNVAVFTGDYYSASLENKVVSVSEAFLKTNGSVGVEKDWPVLSDQGIIDFEDNCTVDFTGLLNKFDLGDKPSFGVYDMRMEIVEIETENTVLTCSSDPAEPSGVGIVTINRYALSEDGKSLRVTFWVW